MRFLFVSEYYPPMHMGGAEISLKLLVEGLAELGHDVTVLTPNYSSPSTSVERMEHLRVIRFKSPRRLLFRERARKASSEAYRGNRPLFYLQLGQYIRFSSAELRRRTMELLRREDFDVVHANNLESILAVSQIETSALKVAHLRDFALLCWNRGLNKGGTLCPGCSAEQVRECMGARLTAPLLSYQIHRRRAVLENFDVLIAISEFVKGQFMRRLGMKSSNINVLYNPVGDRVLSNLSKDEARRLLGLPEDGKVVLFAGTLSEMKGAHLVLRLAERLPEYLFVVVGTGPLRSAFESSRLPNLLYVGYKPIETLRHYYRASDVLVVPSLWHEPFGRVVVEGLANGSFVIGSNRGAIPEVIRWAGGGVVVEPEVESIGRAVESYFDSPVSVERARRRVLKYSEEYSLRFTRLMR
ncbi:Glycosyltransferase [Thermococcus nautili]|uniref:glycosyltransferase n=1 Tax=Thermococcus nautili TaxID=195522 RepID=UPI00255791FF|nr:glycosyltransferase [Thermococcus nautili]CAI1492601.1 Glycosyltransferase [Thermococcus nautili]